MVTEGLPIGQRFESGGRTISEGEFALLTDLTWTLSLLHTDVEFMKGTQFGERILAGPGVLGITLGMLTTRGLNEWLRGRGLRPLALMGYEQVRFLAPVKPGDTLYAETEIVEARATSKPSRGIIKFKDVAKNQRGEVVMEALRTMLVEQVT